MTKLGKKSINLLEKQIVLVKNSRTLLDNKGVDEKLKILYYLLLLVSNNENLEEGKSKILKGDKNDNN
jgi:hypothetical protein